MGYNWAAERRASTGSYEDPYGDNFSAQIRQSLLDENSKMFSDPLDIARSYIEESKGARSETKRALPTILTSISNQVARGQLTPEEARYSYLDLVKSVGGDLSQGFKQAEELSNLQMGFAPAESYSRYKPAASLAFEQLLGRSIGDTEFQNYVSAAQGLGISKGADFQAFLGETLLSSPEYRKQAVIFDPKKVKSGIDTFKSGPTLDEYATMLGAVGK